MWKLIVIASITLVLVGCANPITKYINEHYPPITNSEQRNEAHQALITSLSKVTNPGISAGIAIDDLESRLIHDPEMDSAIKDIKLTGNNQLLDAEVFFEKTFKPDEWMDNPEFSDHLKDVELWVKGSLKFSIGFKAEEFVTETGTTVIEVKGLPSFNGINIKDFQATKDEDSLDVSLVARIINYVLNKYKDNVTAYLTNEPFMQVEIPVNPVDADDPAGMLASSGKTQKQTQLKANNLKINPELKLGNLTFLIDKKFLSLMIEIVPDVAFEPTSLDLSIINFSEARQVYYELHEVVFGEKIPDSQLWMAVSNASLAYVINETIPESKVCFNEASDIPSQKISEKIKFPHESTISCDSDRDCKQTRNCKYDPKVDRRNCRKCLLRAPKLCAFGGCTGGQCIQRGNDPVCEIAKGAQNQLYKLDATAKKVDCERIKEQNRLVCEAEKATEKGLCEVGKEAIKRLNRTGNFANISGNVDGDANLELCISKFTVSNDLSQINTKLSLQGSARVNGDLKFTPLDIVGHLICQMPATTRIRARAGVPEVQIDPNIEISFAKKGKQFGMAYIIEEFDVPFKLTPSPTEILLASPELTFKCSGLNLLKPVIIAANLFVPELRGEFVHEQGPIEGFIKIELPTQTVFNQDLDVNIRASSNAIFLVPDR
jgi:hypothetical protein